MLQFECDGRPDGKRPHEKEFYLDHLERIRRCNITIAQLATEVLAAKQRDGYGALYLTDLRKRLTRFARDFGSRPVAAITVEELDDWLRNLECAPKTRPNRWRTP